MVSFLRNQDRCQFKVPDMKRELKIRGVLHTGKLHEIRSHMYLAVKHTWFPNEEYGGLSFLPVR